MEKAKAIVIRPRYSDHSVDGRSSGRLRKATEESILNTAVPVCDFDLHSEKTNRGSEPTKSDAEIEIDLSIIW